MERPQCHSLALLTYEIQFLNNRCTLKYVAQEWYLATRNEVDALAPESHRLSGMRQPWDWSQQEKPSWPQTGRYHQEQQEPINPNSFLHIFLNNGPNNSHGLDEAKNYDANLQDPIFEKLHS